MILVLYRHPAIGGLAQGASGEVRFCGFGELDSIGEFQRRIVRTLICEWDSQRPPPPFLARHFPRARLMALSAQFHSQAAAVSRLEGFCDHFFLPLPEGFFAQLANAEPAASFVSPLALCTQALQLLEKQPDYSAICEFAAGRASPTTDIGWALHLLDGQCRWNQAFASASWKASDVVMAAHLSRFSGREAARRAEQEAANPDGILSVPLIKEGRVAGAVSCQPEGRAPQHCLSLLDEIALFLGSALQHIDVVAEKERLTFTDVLTGLYNYHYLRQFLASELRRCARYHKGTFILFIDVDWFKEVNDNHGHVTGSDILVELGRHFSSMVRESDVVVRYGGDEFVIILTETNAVAAQAIAERVRKSVESHIFGTGQHLDVRITVSIGVAGYPEHGSSVEELIRRADGAMYEAKNLRKNTVRIAG